MLQSLYQSFGIEAWSDLITLFVHFCCVFDADYLLSMIVCDLLSCFGHSLLRLLSDSWNIGNFVLCYLSILEYR